MDYYFDDWGTGSDYSTPDWYWDDGGMSTPYIAPEGFNSGPAPAAVPDYYWDDGGIGSSGNEPVYTDDWGQGANLANTPFPSSSESGGLTGAMKGIGDWLKEAGWIEYNKNGEWRLSPIAAMLMAGGNLGLSQLMDKQKAKAAEKLVKRNYDLQYEQYKKQKAEDIASIPQIAQASRAAQYKPNVLPYNAQFGTPQYQQVPGLLKL